ncbi:MAG: hypothetical protein ACRERD_14270 [Candidatus Binatia bacterium]
MNMQEFLFLLFQRLGVDYDPALTPEQAINQISVLLQTQQAQPATIALTAIDHGLLASQEADLGGRIIGTHGFKTFVGFLQARARAKADGAMYRQLGLSAESVARYGH